MNIGHISVIMPRQDEYGTHAAVKQLEKVSRKLNTPATIIFRSGCIWAVKAGPLEARHEDFAQCAQEFCQKVENC
jgi:hypothetical protein